MPVVSPLTPLSHGPTAAQWNAAHRALRRNEALWRSLAFQGLQPAPRGRLYEVRCCPACQSTLLRPISRRKAAVLYRSLLQLCEQARSALAERPLPSQPSKAVAA